MKYFLFLLLFSYQAVSASTEKEISAAVSDVVVILDELLVEMADYDTVIMARDIKQKNSDHLLQAACDFVYLESYSVAIYVTDNLNTVLAHSVKKLNLLSDSTNILINISKSVTSRESANNLSGYNPAACSAFNRTQLKLTVKKLEESKSILESISKK